MIPFNKPTFIGTELDYISDAIHRGQISGNGYYTRLCQHFFETRYGFQKSLLTTSCTAALEMSALLCEIQEGDEVIMPSYTFPSMANAFALRGAKIVFVDCEPDIPNIAVDQIELAITPNTKALVIVHYAGYACAMDPIMNIVRKHNLFLIEDCAHAIDSYYKGRPLGTFGHFAAFSFHETKNITCGEGGMLVINDAAFNTRSEIIWEKGTSRVAFKRGEIDRYNWVGLGSSYVLSELNAAYLYGQLQNLDMIQKNRVTSWALYLELLQNEYFKQKIVIPSFYHDITKNGHQFHFLTVIPNDFEELLAFFSKEGIMALSHYQPLHRAPFGQKYTKVGSLANTEYTAGHLIRLPIYHNISEVTIREICKLIRGYFK